MDNANNERLQQVINAILTAQQQELDAQQRAADHAHEFDAAVRVLETSKPEKPAKKRR